MSTTRENDLEQIGTIATSTVYRVRAVGRCWVPDGYTLEHRADDRVVVRCGSQVIAEVKGISAAKTKVTQHVPRQFRTRVEQTWGDRYYPQYWADGRWHNLTDASGAKLWRSRPGEAKMDVLIFLARQQRQSQRKSA